MKTAKKTKIGVFIDEANLFYVQKELGWKIDWEKLKNFLKGRRNFYFYVLNRGLHGKLEKLNTYFLKILENLYCLRNDKPRQGRGGITDIIITKIYE